MEEINSRDIDLFRKLIASSKSAVVVSHTKPDGDAIGSALGISKALQNVGLKTTVVLPDDYPAYYDFLPQSNEILVASKMWDRVEAIVDSADLLVCVDFNNFSRTDCLENLLQKSTAQKLLIDHHLNPDTSAFDLVFSDNTVSSASELVYWVVTKAFGKDVIAYKGAMALYTGICTDTGSFSYSANSPTLYLAVAQLLEKGINVNEIHNKIYQTYSMGRMKLLGHCINNCLKIFPEMKMAYFSVSQKDLKMFDAEKGDLEGVVNYTLMMKDIEVGALVKEGDDGKVRISFRSKYDFDVNRFASKYFEGGGHRKASGASSVYDIEKTCTYMEDCFRLELLNNENNK